MAVILDDFSQLAFSFEWEQVSIRPEDWLETLEAHRPELLFVESAWSGNGGSWRYLLTSSSGVKQPVKDLVGWCRKMRIPTVFWNKEDPAHHEDFLDAASLFDFVFTSDGNMVDGYQKELGHERVGVLRFAAQPAVHNPIVAGQGRHERDIAFAGMYFRHRHEERREQLDLLLGAALAVGPRMEYGLEIFDRQRGGDPRYRFPDSVETSVVGSLSYDEMLTAYRAYKVFLNVNTVTNSDTMCARRIFEVTACGTPIVSTPSAAIDAVFAADEVAQVAEQPEAEFVLRALVRNPELRDRMVHRGQRRIWREHTYSHRVDDVLGAVGLDNHILSRRPRRVTALVSSKRPQQLDHVLTMLGAQREVDIQLAYLAHGWEVDSDEVRRRAQAVGLEDVAVLQAGSEVPLGACLNRLAAVADADLVAKIDDDDFYGPNYLGDQLFALDYSSAEIVGKCAHYVHLVKSGIMALRFPEKEHRFSHFVMGATMVAQRAVVHDHPFPEVPAGEDSGFLRSVVAAGCRVYATDRFNFVEVRGGSSHTWRITDAEVLASSVVRDFGTSFEHVLV
ncbi:MAG: glycosyltransferase [Propioniciclava sp.]